MPDKQIKILVVEDEIQLQKLLADYLAGNGYEVIRANNGQEGLKKALDSRPDLILLDVVMPVMTGLEMLKKLRTDEWGQKAKVALLTNLDDEQSREEAAKHNVHVYFLKAEWSTAEILEKVKELAD